MIQTYDTPLAVLLLQTSVSQQLSPGRIKTVANNKNEQNGIALFFLDVLLKLSVNIYEKAHKFMLKVVYKHVNGKTRKVMIAIQLKL